MSKKELMKLRGNQIKTTNPILEWMARDIIIMKEIQIHFIKLWMKFIGKLYFLKKVVMHDFISVKNAIETKR